MNYIIYILAIVAIFLSAHGFETYKKTGNLIVLVSSLVSVGFSIFAIVSLEWLALAAGFIMVFALKRYIKRFT